MHVAYTCGLLLRKVGENGLKIYSFSTSPSLLQRYGLRYGNINYTGGRRSCYYDMFEKLGILNKEISDYFVKRADAELDRMWNDGTLNEERIESFRHLHERTPYDKPTL